MDNKISLSEITPEKIETTLSNAALVLRWMGGGISRANAFVDRVQEVINAGYDALAETFGAEKLASMEKSEKITEDYLKKLPNYVPEKISPKKIADAQADANMLSILGVEKTSTNYDEKFHRWIYVFEKSDVVGKIYRYRVVVPDLSRLDDAGYVSSDTFLDGENNNDKITSVKDILEKIGFDCRVEKNGDNTMYIFDRDGYRFSIKTDKTGEVLT